MKASFIYNPINENNEVVIAWKRDIYSNKEESKVGTIFAMHNHKPQINRSFSISEMIAKLERTLGIALQNIYQITVYPPPTKKNYGRYNKQWIHNHRTDSWVCVCMRGSRGGGEGPMLYSNTGPNPVENHKSTKPAFNVVGPSFKWRFAGVPMMARFW